MDIKLEKSFLKALASAKALRQPSRKKRPRALGMKLRGEDAQYVMREIANATRRIEELQRAPLSERKEAAAEWLDVMKKNPEIVGERVTWLLDGAYGRGEYEKAMQIYEAPRMNRVAALSHLIAAYEWQTPPREAVAAWKKLTASEKQALEKAIQKAINQHGQQ